MTKRSDIRLLALSTTASLLFLSAPGFAQDQQQSNTQTNIAEQLSKMNATVKDVTGSLEIASTAIGNTFNIEVDGGSLVENEQITTANATSIATVDASAIEGSLSVASSAIGNAANITMDNEINGGALQTNIVNDQNTNTAEFYSYLHLTGTNFNTGAVDLDDETIGLTAASTAIGNTFTVEGTGGMDTGSLDVNTRQVFEGNAIAELEADLENVNGNLELTATAIANAVNIETDGVASVSVTNCQTTDAAMCPDDPTAPPPPPPPAPVDPSAYSTLTVRNIEGNFSSATTAISNSLSVTTLPAQSSLNVDTVQYNSAYNEAIANVDVAGIAGTASITSTAIGNAVNIRNLPDTGDL